MRTLPITASKDDIMGLIFEWTELLAEEKYTEAFAMFLSCNTEFEWTAKRLEEAVYGYGCTGYTREEAQKVFGSADYKVTSLLNCPYKEEIINHIEIEFFEMDERMAACTLTKNPKEIMGDIHYHLVPLNGEPSDLTARFWLRKTDENHFTLEFQDMHVM